MNGKFTILIYFQPKTHLSPGLVKAVVPLAGGLQWHLISNLKLEFGSCRAGLPEVFSSPSDRFFRDGNTRLRPLFEAHDNNHIKNNKQDSTNSCNSGHLNRGCNAKMKRGEP
jgi:hypothetical protein